MVTRRDLWIFFILLLTAAACIPVGHPDIPDKADVEPTPRSIPQKAETKVSPSPSPTPEKSACEIENEQLKDENLDLRRRLNEIEPTPEEGIY